MKSWQGGINQHRINSGICDFCYHLNLRKLCAVCFPSLQALFIDYLENTVVKGIHSCFMMVSELTVTSSISTRFSCKAKLFQSLLESWLLFSRSIICLKWYAKFWVCVNVFIYLWRQYGSLIVLSKELMSLQKGKGELLPKRMSTTKHITSK